ncbi:MAG TPA: ATP-binding protein, partial [Sedimentisphaerales bacterium]|nr:ATP-binding protein [Sedimentisphaerales bacterium]
DFSVMHSLNKQKILELSRCEWIDKRENCCLVGSPGTGKTHIAIALGLAACREGHKVRFFTAAGLVNRLEELRKQYQLERFLTQLDRTDLLICDELGYLTFSRMGAELLFPGLSGRTNDRCLAGSPDPSLPHLRDERRKLQVQAVRTKG